MKCKDNHGSNEIYDEIRNLVCAGMVFYGY